MVRNKISFEKWQNFVSKNCKDAGMLKVCAAILELWNAGCEDVVHAENTLNTISIFNNFTLAKKEQEMAISFVARNDPSEWLMR